MAFTKRKAEKGYKEFLADLKNDSLSSVVLLYGKEQFLVDWAIKAIKDRYVNKATEVMDHQVLDQEADAGTVLSSLATFPMLSEKRVVVIRDFLPLSSAKPKGFTQDELEMLTSYVESAPENVVAVFTSDEIDGRSKFIKSIKKNGNAYEFDSLSTPELEAFAAKRFHACGFKIGRREMNLLLRETGYDNRDSEYDLFRFDNDIQKIMACCDGNAITQEAIADTVIGDNDTFIFDLLDGISGNDKKRAFEVLDNRLSKDQYEAMSVTGAICSQIEIMLEVREMSLREGIGSMEISRRTGLNDFRVKKALGYANRYSEEKLRSMLTEIYDVNKNIVTGLMEPRLALEMFIASI